MGPVAIIPQRLGNGPAQEHSRKDDCVFSVAPVNLGKAGIPPADGKALAPPRMAIQWELPSPGYSRARACRCNVRSLIVSDIHSNLEALEAVLAHAKGAGGFDVIWCLGDIVGYGPDPSDCLRRLREFDLVAVAGQP